MYPTVKKRTHPVLYMCQKAIEQKGLKPISKEKMSTSDVKKKTLSQEIFTLLNNLFNF